MTSRRRAVLAVVVAAGLLLFWFGGPHLARRMSIFRVRRVEVVGSQYLTAAEVARTAKIPPDANIFDDTDGYRRLVLAIRGVQNVTVRRRLPGALEFEVVEFLPVAQTQIKGRLVLLDRRGRELPFDPTRAPVDLPIAEADSAVTGLLERLAEAEPELHKRVLSGSRDRDVIILETERHRLLFRVGAGTQDMQGAAAVVAELARRQFAAAEVDARFEGRVLVRGGRG